MVIFFLRFGKKNAEALDFYYLLTIFPTKMLALKADIPIDTKFLHKEEKEYLNDADTFLLKRENPLFYDNCVEDLA
jgi:hypothetical protein